MAAPQFREQPMNVVNFTKPEENQPSNEKLRKQFMRQKRAWIDRMSLNRDIPSFAFRLAYHIASKYMNNTSGDAWPKQKTLGADLGVCVKTIQNGLVALEKAGLIAVQGTRGDVNHYRPIFETIDVQPTQILAHIAPEGTQILSHDPRKFFRTGSEESFLHEPFLSNPLNEPREREHSLANCREKRANKLARGIQTNAGPDRICRTKEIHPVQGRPHV
jgi:hypothetical protein